MSDSWLDVLSGASAYLSLSRIRRRLQRIPHEHQFILIGNVERAMVDVDDPIRHTSFMVLGCPLCRAVEFFPPDNYQLTTPAVRESLRRALVANQWKP